jgi:hypothetical protein
MATAGGLAGQAGAAVKEDNPAERADESGRWREVITKKDSEKGPTYHQQVE